MAEAVHPLQPLQRRLYSCGRHFSTSALREQVEVEKSPAYGLVVIDGADAVIGTAQGLGTAARATVAKLAQLQSNTASSTRRGGQSALRYSRLRDAEDLAFCRRVAERAGQLLGGVRGVVLAGKADTKRRLQAELPQTLRRKVLCVVDLPCNSNVEGLRQAASRAGDAASSEQRGEAEHAVRSFLETAAMPDSAAGVACCYGEQQTATALALGAVEVLLVAADWAGPALTKDDWWALAAAHGTRIVEIESRTQDSSQFCQAFGVGGCLRWPVDPDMLEEPEAAAEADAKAHEQAEAEAFHSLAPPARCEDIEATDAKSALHGAENARLAKERPRDLQEARGEVLAHAAPRSTPSTHGHGEGSDVSGLFEWLPGALREALGDESAAEALAAGVEVILDSAPAERHEALELCVGMLLSEGIPQDVVDELVARAQ